MSFIRIYPLRENRHMVLEHFGRGDPARCYAHRKFGAEEFYLNVSQIASFESCPLYLISESEPDALVDGVRLHLVSGDFIVVPDDAEEDDNKFVILLERAVRGEVVKMPFSRYLQTLSDEGKS
jgi:hypothetical protein